MPPLGADGPGRAGVLGWLHSVARAHVEVALNHPVRLIANALGPPPADVIDQAHERGLLVAALAGRADHARSHVAAGVDLVVAQGYEAGGHTGEIASMVLVPEVVDAVGEQVPVLAAGGIGSGRQIAAALALGARGVWMGSVWLGTAGIPQRPRAPRGTAAGRLRRHGAQPHLLRKAGPPAAQPLDRGVERSAGAPARCRCRCRTCWWPRRTPG